MSCYDIPERRQITQEIAGGACALLEVKFYGRQEAPLSSKWLSSNLFRETCSLRVFPNIRGPVASVARKRYSVSHLPPSLADLYHTNECSMHNRETAPVDFPTWKL